ncbi:MAG: site-specific DNA-methyltransferase [Treponematales bacterium]
MPYFPILLDWVFAGCAGEVNPKNKEIRIHPTQKPVPLYKWLLEKYAKPGMKILDTHGGSFSSGIAALELGFEYTGIELDEDYFNMALARMREAWESTVNRETPAPSDGAHNRPPGALSSGAMKPI